jgi:CheY-like chemotaxis protein
LWLDLAPAQEGALPETPAPGLRAGQILVVEDEQEIRQTLAEALRQRGYQVLEAADGRQALSVYHKNASTIALVVLDLVLPELDGRRVYEELAKLPNPPAVLLSTGYVPDSDPLLARLPRLLKPFSLEAFLQEVEKRVKPTAA